MIELETVVPIYSWRASEW